MSHSRLSLLQGPSCAVFSPQTDCSLALCELLILKPSCWGWGGDKASPHSTSLWRLALWGQTQPSLKEVLSRSHRGRASVEQEGPHDDFLANNLRSMVCRDAENGESYLSGPAPGVPAVWVGRSLPRCQLCQHWPPTS